jgi:hypothetical protein
MNPRKESSKTNIFLIDQNLWKWAKYRSDMLGYRSVSEYLFQLIKNDKEKQESTR